MPRHVLHDVAQRRCGARLHAFAGAGQDIVGYGRLGLLRRRWCFTRRIERSLKRTNGVFEGQTVRFEDFSGNASGIADDGGEHDGAVDVTPAAATRCGRCGFENAANLGRDAERILRRCTARSAFEHAGNDVAFDPFTADMARVEHGNGIGIVTKGCEQMLKRDL